MLCTVYALLPACYVQALQAAAPIFQRSDLISPDFICLVQASYTCLICRACLRIAG